MQVKLIALITSDLMTGKAGKPDIWEVIAMRSEKGAFSIQNFVFSYFKFQIQYSWTLTRLFY
jgi:hypothetical protein